MDFKLCDPFRTLYPSKRAFSYSPVGTIRQNRSRLDFFVVSQSLIQNIVDCSISPGLSTKLFDHKSVLLSLGTKINYKKKPGPRVGNSFLKENYVIASVNLAAIKCHVHSLELENNLKNDLLNRCNAMGSNLSEIRKMQENMAIKGVDNVTEIAIAGNFALFAEFKNEIENSGISDWPKRCNQTVFFEALCEQVFLSAASAQKHCSRMATLKQSRLAEEISLLSANFDENHAAIFSLEKQLNTEKETQIREKLADSKVFEHLSAERASQHFLNLAMATKEEHSLNDIKDDTGDVSLEGDVLNRHIPTFYRSLYRLEEQEDQQGEIADFLGPDIVRHPIVKASILSETEKRNLDSELEILELDSSLEQSNLKSAPGPDGFSYKFIKSFWKIFRIPLFECAKFGLENGNLPAIFKTANIKLIPKKGETSNIKNGDR